MRLANACLFLASALTFSNSASAAIAFVAPTGGGNTSFTTTDLGFTEIGQGFTTSGPITIVSLGLFDDLVGSFGGPVGIYRVSDQALMVSANISSSDPLTVYPAASFRFQAVTPTLLAAGTYTIAAYIPGQKLTGGFNPANVGAGITSGSISSAEGGSLVFPATPRGNLNGFYGLVVGGNFQFNPGDTTVPEPGTYALLVAGLGAIAVARRRKGA